MKGLKNRFLAVFTAVFMLLGCATSFGAENKEVLSKSVRLSSYQGNVTVSKGEKALSKITTDMRLFDGYAIKTAADSYAFLELDDTKFVKIDQNSNIKIQKKGKSNSLLIQSGALFFNVTKPLTEDESLEVHTSNVTMGVRGTTGSVSSKAVYDSQGNLKNVVVDAQIYTGLGYLTVTNNKTGEKNSMEIEPGNRVKITADAVSDDTKIVKEELTSDGFDIPAVAQGELIKMPEILKQIQEDTKLDTGLLIKNYEIKQAREDKQAKEETVRGEGGITEVKTVASVPFTKEQTLEKKEYTGDDIKAPAVSDTTNDENNNDSDRDPHKPKPIPPVNPDKPIDPDKPVDPDKPIDPEIPEEPGTDDGVVASIGDTEYESLEAALVAATTGQTILILKNISIISDTTVGNGITLIIPDDVSLKVSEKLIIDGALTIRGSGILVGSSGSELIFGTNGTCDISSAQSTEIYVDGELINSATNVRSKTFYYLGHDEGDAVWENWDGAVEDDNFDNIDSDDIIIIRSGETKTLPVKTWKNDGILIIRGKLLGSPDSYIYCTKDSMLLADPGTIYNQDGGQITSNFGHEFLAKWDDTYKRFIKCSGALIGDNAYTLEDALSTANSGETISLIGDDPIITTSDITLKTGVTLEIDSSFPGLHIGGTLNIESGASIISSGNITVDSGGRLNIESEGSIINSGTITVSSGGELNIANRGLITNSAFITAESGSTLIIENIGSISTSGNINIRGTVKGIDNIIPTTNGTTLTFDSDATISDENGIYRYYESGGSMQIRNGDDIKGASYVGNLTNPSTDKWVKNP